MGQGQEVHARRLLANAILNGGWVLLQNCHLSAEMCIEIVETLTEAETIENSFRLWITTEEQPKFPISLLQVRKKMRRKKEEGEGQEIKRKKGGGEGRMGIWVCTKFVEWGI